MVLSCMDLDMSSMIQLIISSSMNTGTTVSLTEHFCNKARQNLCITDPFYSFFKILMTLRTTLKSFLLVIYYTPLSVLHVILIKGRREYRSFGFGLSSRSIRNCKFSFYSILNRSFRMSSQTRFLRSSGAICNAFTLKLSNTQHIPSTFLSFMNF